MPKKDTITFEVEPAAVLEAAEWLIKHDPFSRSIMTASLTPEQRLARETEYLTRVNRTAEQMIGWLRRRNRLKSPMVRTRLCLDRDLVAWMANFDRTRGLFGSSAKSTIPVGAQYFFSRCKIESSRRVGRPRMSPQEAHLRIMSDLPSNIPHSTYYRLTARQSEGFARRSNDLSGLLRLAASREPKTPE